MTGKVHGRWIAHDFLKRSLDIAVAGSALLLLAIPMAVLAVLIRVRMGRPVLFTQDRPGRHGRIFRIIKFRSMTSERDEQGELLADAERLTPFGRWLRSTSLDELPELWNVLRGDMSLIGPRPLLVEYLPVYTAEQARRHEVRPGLTGWAQVHGRNATTWEERFKLDVWYVDHRTTWLDLKILLMTIVKVLGREGISADGEATMPRLTMGSDGRKIAGADRGGAGW
jgi:sugar transferase EpsL